MNKKYVLIGILFLISSNITLIAQQTEEMSALDNFIISHHEELGVIKAVNPVLYQELLINLAKIKDYNESQANKLLQDRLDQVKIKVLEQPSNPYTIKLTIFLKINNRILHTLKEKSPDAYTQVTKQIKACIINPKDMIGRQGEKDYADFRKLKFVDGQRIIQNALQGLKKGSSTASTSSSTTVASTTAIIPIQHVSELFSPTEWQNIQTAVQKMTLMTNAQRITYLKNYKDQKTLPSIALQFLSDITKLSNLENMTQFISLYKQKIGNFLGIQMKDLLNKIYFKNILTELDKLPQYFARAMEEITKQAQNNVINSADVVTIINKILPKK
jgi:hypothetical protein